MGRGGKKASKYQMTERSIVAVDVYVVHTYMICIAGSFPLSSFDAFNPTRINLPLRQIQFQIKSAVDIIKFRERFWEVARLYENNTNPL